jgi:hypothetical protein
MATNPEATVIGIGILKIAVPEQPGKGAYSFAFMGV